MKKNLCKTLALCLVMLMAFSVAASAATISRDTSATDTVTISVAGVGASDEVTLLVVPTGADLASITAERIIYIDQTTAGADGNATFTFATPTGKFDAYSGFTTMNVADGALSDTDKGDTPDPGADTPTIDATKTKMYAKAFDLEGYKRIFVKLTEENGQWMPAHKDADSAIYYSTEREGYDGLIKSEAADINAALAELTWTKAAPTEEQIIAKYGNTSGDEIGDITAADYANVKRAVLGSVEYSIKQNLIADVNNDSSISAADYAAIKRVVLGTAASFAVSEDK